MNTIEELLDMGLNQHNAEIILDFNNRKIGTEHGDFMVEDMTYRADKTRDVILSCRYCGTKLHKIIYSDAKRRTKWNKVQSVCDCHRQASKEITAARRMKEESEHREKLERNIGMECGDYIIAGIDGRNYVAQCKICGQLSSWSIARFSARTDYLCHAHRMTKERFTEAYIGMKNNYLTVIGITHGDDGRKLFRCRCDCGRITLVKPSKWEDGSVKSCNCYITNRSKDAAPEDRIKNIWTGMKRRCYSPSCKDYPNYGGRGIVICPEWQIFDNFLKWSMENEYDNTKTIDRIDSDGNYEPGNCRWTNWDVQNSNRRPRKSQKYYEEQKNGTTD